MTVSLLIPALNEVEGKRVIMPRIKREWVDQILVIDGGSTDGTAEYAREHGYALIRQKRKGLRHALIEAVPGRADPAATAGEVIILTWLERFVAVGVIRDI